MAMMKRNRLTQSWTPRTRRNIAHRMAIRARRCRKNRDRACPGISHFNKRHHRVDGGKRCDQDTRLEYLATLQEEYCPEHGSEKDQEEEYPCPVFLTWTCDTHS